MVELLRARDVAKSRGVRQSIWRPATAGPRTAEVKTADGGYARVKVTPQANINAYTGPKGSAGGGGAPPLVFERYGPPSAVPFDPRAPPMVVRARARPVAAWTVTRRKNKADEPPPSPVDCATAGACGEETTIALVPFGSTQTRVAAFPWY